MDREEFAKSVALAHRLTDAWPDWKRGVLEASSKSTCKTPRKPVYNGESLFSQAMELGVTHEKIILEAAEKMRRIATEMEHAVGESKFKDRQFEAVPRSIESFNGPFSSRKRDAIRIVSELRSDGVLTDQDACRLIEFISLI